MRLVAGKPQNYNVEMISMQFGIIVIDVIMNTRAISLKAISLKSFAMENDFM